MAQRLNKYLAFHLGVSRREADKLISDGIVTINGSMTQLGSRVEDGNQVAVRGKNVIEKNNYSYLLLNKPVNYVCSRAQQGGCPTIYALLPKQFHNLKPVGRLDKNSSGLLILTDDGDFAFSHTHPQFYKTKVYKVGINTPLAPLHQQMISDFGITLEDGPSKLSLSPLDDSRQSWTVTMHEGRNRQIRRTFFSLGYEVTRLHRISFGPYQLGDLQPGKYLELKPSI